MAVTGGNRRYQAATVVVPLPLVLVALACLPAGVHAQAGPRTDTPRRNTFRVTFEPVITTWDREFTVDGHEQPIGASLATGVSVREGQQFAPHGGGVDVTNRIVVVPTTVFVHEERRVTPLAVDFGITNRLSVGVKLPLVRVNTREGYPRDSSGNFADTAGVRRLDSLLASPKYAFDPLISTRKRLMYWPGDPEFEAKYRFLESHTFAASAALVVRLGWAHQDSPNNLFDLSSGDNQTDVELQGAGELLLFDHLWLNGLLRAGRQMPGTRSRRVGPQDELLLPAAALATLNWDPGDYTRLDFAPMIKLGGEYAFGFTVGYYRQQQDRYTYQSAQDSIDIATRLGAPISASVLNAGTDWRWTRLGIAMTYRGRDYEGSMSLESTVSGRGALLPSASVFRILMRASRWPF